MLLWRRCDVGVSRSMQKGKGRGWEQQQEEEELIPDNLPGSGIRVCMLCERDMDLAALRSGITYFVFYSTVVSLNRFVPCCALSFSPSFSLSAHSSMYLSTTKFPCLNDHITSSHITSVQRDHSHVLNTHVPIINTFSGP